jgi:hypothetical protein
MMNPAAPLQAKSTALQEFSLLNYGSIDVAAGPSKFGFEIEVTPSVVLSEVYLALVQPDTTPAQQRVGFGIRIDWERGEIWDALNGAGIVGWLEDDWSNFGSTVKLSFQIERIGSALLPRLIIGSEEWLYPALRSSSALTMMALAGVKGNTPRELDPEDIFDDAYLWQGKR